MGIETIEQAAERYCLINNIPIDQMIVKNDRSCEFKTPITMFIDGAKWQSEKMYSEEEVLNILDSYHNDQHSIDPKPLEKWFERYKK